MFTAIEIERKIKDIENITVVIRAKSDKQQFNDYSYERKFAGNLTMDSWVNNRLKKSIGNTQFEIIRGDGTNAPLTMTMDSVRNCYNEWYYIQ